jgi:hypothetical protein
MDLSREEHEFQLLPFKGQRTNGREARESGPWLKAVPAPQRIVLSMARK